MSERITLCALTDVWLPAPCDVAQLGTCRPHQTSRHCNCKTLRNHSKNTETRCRGSQWTGLGCN